MSDGGISFRLTDEQRELQRLAHDFAARELRPVAPEWDEREAYPPELLAKAAKAGLTSYAIPTEYGGGGAGSVTSALISEELSWGCAGLASTIQATMFPVRPLVRFGTPAQRRLYLPLLAREQGDARRDRLHRSACGLRPRGDPNRGAPRRRRLHPARREGVRHERRDRRPHARLRQARRCHHGVHRRARRRGCHGGTNRAQGGPTRVAHRVDRSSTTLAFPQTASSAEEGQGFEIALDFFQASRPQVAAAAVGLARAAFEHATEYAREREAFGSPILNRQGVGFKLADMAIQIEAARLLVWRACAAVDAGEDAGLLGSYAKAFAADTAMSVTTDAVQVLGGAGIMRDHPVEKWLRDAKVFQIVEGTSEIQRQIVTTYLAGDGAGQSRS